MFHILTLCLCDPPGCSCKIICEVRKLQRETHGSGGNPHAEGRPGIEPYFLINSPLEQFAHQVEFLGQRCKLTFLSHFQLCAAFCYENQRQTRREKNEAKFMCIHNDKSTDLPELSILNP